MRDEGSPIRDILRPPQVRILPLELGHLGSKLLDQLVLLPSLLDPPPSGVGVHVEEVAHGEVSVLGENRLGDIHCPIIVVRFVPVDPPHAFLPEHGVHEVVDQDLLFLSCSRHSRVVPGDIGFFGFVIIVSLVLSLLSEAYVPT